MRMRKHLTLMTAGLGSMEPYALRETGPRAAHYCGQQLPYPTQVAVITDRYNASKKVWGYVSWCPVANSHRSFSNTSSVPALVYISWATISAMLHARSRNKSDKDTGV